MTEKLLVSFTSNGNSVYEKNITFQCVMRKAKFYYAIVYEVINRKQENF